MQNGIQNTIQSLNRNYTMNLGTLQSFQDVQQLLIESKFTDKARYIVKFNLLNYNKTPLDKSIEPYEHFEMLEKFASFGCTIGMLQYTNMIIEISNGLQQREPYTKILTHKVDVPKIGSIRILKMLHDLDVLVTIDKAKANDSKFIYKLETMLSFVNIIEVSLGINAANQIRFCIEILEP